MINDNELVQIFIEEGRDLLESLNNDLEQWRLNLTEDNWLTSIFRELHTFKGSARMVGLSGLSEYLHCLEQIIDRIQHGQLQPQANIIKEIQLALDYIHIYIEALANQSVPENDEIPIAQLKFLLNIPHDPLKSEIETITMEELQTDEIKEAAKVQASTDVIRVKTNLLEKFSKLAGQVNVARAHLEQQLEGVYGSLADMTKEIKLIQEQMRHLQVKADANLRMYQDELSKKDYEEFDILELDRYSSLQQATRILVDKLEELEDLNTFVMTSVHNAENLIIEQGRAARSLEEGITHTRMTSIDQIVPRLERIVRQVSQDLEKEVRLECIKAYGEVDRRILERLIPPLEHMVRNAIDHGIETPQIRKAAGKPYYGVITLSLFRQGNEIVIQLGDDGQGINIEMVKEKAIEKKLWPDNAPMTMQDAMQIISFPGFSTKSVVTPVSGRGVGMDVVNAEVNKLGGTLQIFTERHRGTQFTIRLPFMLSLNQALILLARKQPYAMLLSNLAGITRLSFEQLKEKFKTRQYSVHYAKEEYPLFYLTELLGEGRWEDYRPQLSALPIIFLKSETGKIGLILDGLVGSREIVIKPAGIQLQFVKEISGVSLLGDGQIVLMLNGQYLIERALGKVNKEVDITLQEKVGKIKVLIVDDSTTVRQVTSRFLKRHRYEPLTANDGVEALSVMEENLPDIVLLDIEMPRMDGFEVIKKMKENPKLKHIPIIMITSRAGEKHQLRAMNAGANAYLVKPYHEEELLVLLKKFYPIFHRLHH